MAVALHLDSGVGLQECSRGVEHYVCRFAIGYSWTPVENEQNAWWHDQLSSTFRAHHGTWTQ
jgi:hypothetical protein